MKESNLITAISYKDFKHHVAGYSSTVPKDLESLEEQCRETIPSILAQRKEDGEAYLDKTEVTTLLEWKLKHGKYRPTLPKLVASNSPSDIHTLTHEAFAQYTTNSSDPIKALNTLVKLKGIGPATASLLLSCFDQTNIPFFSDELFRYLHFNDDEGGNGKGKGWERKIGYTMKEYRSVLEKTTALRKRLDEGKGEGEVEVTALEVERVADALFKLEREGPGKSVDEEKDGNGGEEEEEEEEEKRPAKRRRVRKG